MNKRGDFLGLSTEQLVKVVLSIAMILLLIIIGVGLLSLFLNTEEKAFKTNFEALANQIKDAVREPGNYYLDMPNIFHNIKKKMYILAFDKGKDTAPWYRGYAYQDGTVYKPSSCVGACLCLYDDAPDFGTGYEPKNPEKSERDKDVVECITISGVDKIRKLQYDQNLLVSLIQKPLELSSLDSSPPPFIIDPSREGGKFLRYYFFWSTDDDFLNYDDLAYLTRIEKIVYDGKTEINIIIYPSDFDVTKIYDAALQDRQEFMNSFIQKTSSQLITETLSLISSDDSKDFIKVSNQYNLVDSFISKNPGDQRIHELEYEIEVLRFLMEKSSYYEKIFSIPPTTFTITVSVFSSISDNLNKLMLNKGKPGYENIDFDEVEYWRDAASLYAKNMAPRDFIKKHDNSRGNHELADYGELLYFEAKSLGMSAPQSYYDAVETAYADLVSKRADTYKIPKVYYYLCMVYMHNNDQTQVKNMVTMLQFYPDEAKKLADKNGLPCTVTVIQTP